MNKQLMIAGFITLLLTSCDPAYPINLSNDSNESIIVLVKVNSPFQTEKEKVGITKNGFYIYQFNAHESAQVGMAIAEIDNDIPFSELKIVRSGNDTVSVSTMKEIMQLFDRKRNGKLRIPYVLRLN